MPWRGQGLRTQQGTGSESVGEWTRVPGVLGGLSFWKEGPHTCDSGVFYTPVVL